MYVYMFGISLIAVWEEYGFYFLVQYFYGPIGIFGSKIGRKAVFGFWMCVEDSFFIWAQY